MGKIVYPGQYGKNQEKIIIDADYCFADIIGNDNDDQIGHVFFVYYLADHFYSKQVIFWCNFIVGYVAFKLYFTGRFENI